MTLPVRVQTAAALRLVKEGQAEVPSSSTSDGRVIFNFASVGG